LFETLGIPAHGGMPTTPQLMGQCTNFGNQFKRMERNTVALDQLKARIGSEEFETPSPFGTWLKGKLLLAEAGALEAEYQVRPEMANPIGTLHGGVIAAIFDDLIGATMFSLGTPGFMSSINLSVDFMAPAKPGEMVRVRTAVSKEGKQLAHANAWMYNQEGKLLATCSSNLFRMQPKG
jgi:acyl-coenzyme A thioesterase 13